tara:strand:+ start:520 stop:936 length:417 start_codon:yes stop_codon:yes gene_type:complete
MPKTLKHFKWYKAESAYGGWGFDEYKGIESLFEEYNIVGRRNNPYRNKEQIFFEKEEAKGFVEVMNVYVENFNLTDEQENLLIKHLQYKGFNIEYGKKLIKKIEKIKDETYPNFFEHVPSGLAVSLANPFEVKQEWVK